MSSHITRSPWPAKRIWKHRMRSIFINTEVGGKESRCKGLRADARQSGLCAVRKEIKIWHVIQCRGSRRSAGIT